MVFTEEDTALLWLTCLTANSVCHSHPDGLVRVLSPTEAKGGAWHACNQSPECEAEAASNLPLSTSCTALDMSCDAWLTTIPWSHTFWMCCASLTGLDDPHNAAHVISVDAVAVSSSALMLGGRMAYWRSSVDAADTKKAEGASICALRSPSPPLTTGSEAWRHSSSLLLLLLKRLKVN